MLDRGLLFDSTRFAPLDDLHYPSAGWNEKSVNSLLSKKPPANPDPPSDMIRDPKAADRR